MNRSSRFLSLSGLSGVLAGIFAIIAAGLAYTTVYEGQDYLGYRQATLDNNSLFKLILIALVTLVLSVGVGILFSYRKAKKENLNMWDNQAKMLVINLAIPLLTGGALCLIFLSKGYIGIIAPLTLVFYGLALVNASKYTLQEVRSLGLLEILLGLIATYFIGFGLLFWVIGFGLLHIVYGLYMYVKYGA